MKEIRDPIAWAETQRQLEILKSGVVEVTPEDEFTTKLYQSILLKKPLRVKCGIDPTGSDIHLGHLVPYRKMRQFQDLGHIGVVIIGDYTARIGDPTGKNESRPALTEELVKVNANRYMDQLFTVLDRSRTEIHYQTKWFSDFSLATVIKWASKTTVAKLMQHETFRKRLEEGEPLSLHELFYPMLQGIDSVYVKADVELGGTDQKFNVLMGRDYQKVEGDSPQVAVLLPILTGTDGVLKMSKSLGNYIGILDEPFDKFGKIMRIPDTLMIDYFTYIAGFEPKKIREINEGLQSGKLHPNETKKDLATYVVSFFHGEDVGQEMRSKFESVFKEKKVPDDAPQITFERGIALIEFLAKSGLFETKGEIRRLIDQGGCHLVDGDKLTEPNLKLDESFSGKSLKLGKRKFIRLL